MRELYQQLNKKIKTLNELLWGRRITNPVVEQWLNNFTGELPDSKEKIHALYILSCFMYFGDREIRALLKTLFYELFKCRIISDIRTRNNDTSDLDLINKEFKKELKATIFLGVGNPSESGCHLLYFFRQENSLDINLFANDSDILKISRNSKGEPIPKLRHPEIKRYVYIDDFCGSGQQIIEYLYERTKLIKELKSGVELCYYVLFGSLSTLQTIKSAGNFDRVDTVCELGASYKCFQSDRYFKEYGDKLDKHFAKNMCQTYGDKLFPAHPLGYKGGEFLIGFYHNVPDNTLPIIWSEGNGDDIKWHPIFKRYPKINFEW
ncbi:hypothetical protein CEE45_17530 [Candidatus Heimdallarchaeota archaeon B3_Heim]|nr:MAG: hypothetical protein CEE45_17530 [Candidatus Heimdallarchaeota archaeon B3_Heim]